MCQFLPSHNQKNAWHIALITAVEEEVPAQYAASKSLRHVDNFGCPSGEVPPLREVVTAADRGQGGEAAGAVAEGLAGAAIYFRPGYADASQPVLPTLRASKDSLSSCRGSCAAHSRYAFAYCLYLATTFITYTIRRVGAPSPLGPMISRRPLREKAAGRSGRTSGDRS
jgi:hypothetical protein